MPPEGERGRRRRWSEGDATTADDACTPNECGGCARLEHKPRSPCGQCGTLECSADRNALECDDPGYATVTEVL